MTIWDCRTRVRMTSMTSSVERTDLDFKISVALPINILRSDVVSYGLIVPKYDVQLLNSFKDRQIQCTMKYRSQ